MQKDLNGIYVLMRTQLHKNPTLLITYFNVMILSSAFKLNRTFSNNSVNPQCDFFHQPPTTTLNDSLDLDNNNDESVLSGSSASYSRSSSSTTTNSSTSSTTHTNKSHQNHHHHNHNKTGEYDADVEYADAELSAHDDEENDNDNDDDDDEHKSNPQENKGRQTEKPSAEPPQSPQNYKYDLILFPKILEICLSYLIGVKKKQYVKLKEIMVRGGGGGGEGLSESLEKFALRYERFDKATHAYLKRVLYLLETCTFNVQIIIYNNYRQYFIDLLAQKPMIMLCTSQELEKVNIK